MAHSLLLEKALTASCSSPSASRPIRSGQRLSAEADCCCSVSGRLSRNDIAGGVRSKGGLCALSPLSAAWGFHGGSLVQRLGKEGGGGRRRRENPVVTMALPADVYWITAAEAIGVAVLMAGFAVVAGVLINIRLEVDAYLEYKVLEAKGMLPEEMNIPDEAFSLDEPLYILQSKELSSSTSLSRNRPVREEFQAELPTELKTELAETTGKE